jgi:hypothetical protein
MRNQRFDQAIKRYFDVLGPNALQPDHHLSTTTANQTVFLKNVNGLLAVVTSKGYVFDHLGGHRLDQPTTTRRAAL